VVHAAAGLPGKQIARVVGLSEQSVCKWRIRFRDRGLAGLDDAPRSGRPLVYGPTDRLVLMAKVTEEHPQVDAQWSHSELAAEMRAAAIPISASQIGRILAADDVKPHRVQGWLTRRDTPEFWERAADVCGLYLAPPANAVVLSVDEKTGIQAKSRRHPTQAVRPGRLERREFEYVRHGTASLIAALDVATGKVTATDVARNDSAHFIEFLTQLDESIDPALAIHVVLDNGSSHRSKATQKVRRAPPVRGASHPGARELAEPGRIVLLDPYPQGSASRRVRLTRRPREQDARVHRTPQHHRHPVQMGLRRPTRRMTHVQPTSARQH
jgi:transposase